MLDHEQNHTRRKAAQAGAMQRVVPSAWQSEHLITFAIGALGYGCLELAWRGYTHWTMLVCGGLALLMLRRLSRTALPFLLQCTVGALSITGLELAAGLLLNRALGLGIWDYSGRWGNLWGQICPFYSVLWFLLCIPLLGAMRIAWPDDAGAKHPGRHFR